MSRVEVRACDVCLEPPGQENGCWYTVVDETLRLSGEKDVCHRCAKLPLEDIAKKLRERAGVVGCTRSAEPVRRSRGDW